MNKDSKKLAGLLVVLVAPLILSGCIPTVAQRQQDPMMAGTPGLPLGLGEIIWMKKEKGAEHIRRKKDEDAWFAQQQDLMMAGATAFPPGTASHAPLPPVPVTASLMPQLPIIDPGLIIWAKKDGAARQAATAQATTTRAPVTRTTGARNEPPRTPAPASRLASATTRIGGPATHFASYTPGAQNPWTLGGSARGTTATGTVAGGTVRVR